MYDNPGARKRLGRSLNVSKEVVLQVHCKICKRNGGSDDSIVQKFQTDNMFTHHQKSVILDATGLEGGPSLDTANLDKGELKALQVSCVSDCWSAGGYHVLVVDCEHVCQLKCGLVCAIKAMSWCDMCIISAGVA